MDLGGMPGARRAGPRAGAGHQTESSLAQARSGATEAQHRPSQGSDVRAGAGRSPGEERPELSGAHGQLDGVKTEMAPEATKLMGHLNFLQYAQDGF